MYDDSTIPGKPRFACTHVGCAKDFSTLGNLNHHIAVDHHGKRYVCPFPACDKQYTRAVKLTKHELAAHAGELFVCLERGCRRAFLDEALFGDHVRVVHHGSYVPPPRPILPEPPEDVERGASGSSSAAADWPRVADAAPSPPRDAALLAPAPFVMRDVTGGAGRAHSRRRSLADVRELAAPASQENKRRALDPTSADDATLRAEAHGAAIAVLMDGFQTGAGTSSGFGTSLSSALGANRAATAARQPPLPRHEPRREACAPGDEQHALPPLMLAQPAETTCAPALGPT
jgi:hypothetical protein